MAGIHRYFGHLADDRQSGKVDYPLITIITIVLLGTLCGCEGWLEISEWADFRRDWLATFLELGPEGLTPCETTLARVFGRLKPRPFRDAFFAWAQALHAATTGDQGSIAIDGKALRAAMKRSTDKNNLTFVSAFATNSHLVLGVVKAADKSNEITAIPELLAMLDLRKAHVTIDAAGTQTAIAEQIIKAGGDYTLALKGNQGTTFQAVSETLTDAALDSFKNVTSKAHSTSEIGHGRSEERRVVAVKVEPSMLPDERWTGLKSLVWVERERASGTAYPSVEHHYYLSSLAHTEVVRIAASIRAHWSIENNLHWVLDTQFNEDSIAICEANSAENLAMLRRFALNCLQKRQDVRGSKRWKAKRALADTTFMIETLLRGLP